MIIQVLGSGCNNCKRLLENVQISVKELNLDAQIQYVTDYLQIVNSGLLRTPGLIIDGKIVSSGRVPSVTEVKTLLQNAK
jgi:small redox-active disulfide protein 2